MDVSGQPDHLPGPTLLGQTPILVVDDDPFARRAIAIALKTAGFVQLSEAHDAAAAIDKLQDQRIVLLITDVQMPGWNGVEMLKQIRAGNTPARRDLRIIVHTSFAQRDVLGAAMALDANGFLVKPAKAAMVRRKVESAISEPMVLRGAHIYEAVATALVSIPALAPGESAPQPYAVMASPGVFRPLAQVKPGMKLADDVRTSDGTLLLARGQELSQPHINRLHDLEEILASGEIHVEDELPG